MSLISPLYATSASGGNNNVELFFNRDKKVFYYFLMENWFYFNVPEANFILSRPAIAYNVTDKLSLWLGCTYAQGLNLPSHRTHSIFEQLEYKLIDREAINIVIRTRVLQRYYSLASGVSIKLRERIFITFPHLLSDRLSPVIYDELFVALNHPVWEPKPIITQNRLFLGVETPLNKQIYLHIGYLSQTVTVFTTGHNNLVELRFLAQLD